ncbi:MAG: 30S ribosomal protein S11 [Patescibacteria group bacterium]|nr:30S ribosomal protein S11 [Patescibacteria group bacterium]
MSEKVSSKKSSPKASKALKQISRGRIYIYSTYNNTIITVTDLQGNVICSSSAGRLGFSGPKKATPHAAGIVAKNVMEEAKKFGLKEAQILVKGIGTGRDAAVRAVCEFGLNITSIKDITPIPHNGCRPPKIRRV